MAVWILPEARDDLREAARYYRTIPPPALGRQLAAGLLAAFRDAVSKGESFGLSRAEHPDIPLARFVVFARFPYLAFYTVKERDLFVVSVEHASSDYVERGARRMAGVP